MKLRKSLQAPTDKPAPAVGPTLAFYTVDEAAKLLQVCRRTLMKLVSARDIPHLRVGRQIRFTPEHIAKFSERATVTTRRRGAQA